MLTNPFDTDFNNQGALKTDRKLLTDEEDENENKLVSPLDIFRKIKTISARKSKGDGASPEEDKTANRKSNIRPSSIVPQETLKSVISSWNANKELYTKMEKDTDVVELTYIDPKLVGRLAVGKLVKKYIVYPEDTFRTVWDVITTS